MKSRFIKTTIGIFVFLFIFAVSLYIMTPIYRTVDSMMRNAEARFLEEFSSKTNLTLSYDSLSPSIFRGITVKNIRVFEVSTGDEILSIRKITISYNLLRIMKKDFEHAFSKLTISGVQFQFDKDRYVSLIEKLKSLRTPKGYAGIDVSDSVSDEFSVNVDGMAGLKPGQKEFIKKSMSFLPYFIQIKDVSFLYNDLKKSMSLRLKKLDLMRLPSGNISMNCNSGYILAAMSYSVTKTLGTRFSFSGKVVPGFSGSSVIVSFDQYRNADISLYKTQFLFHYKDNCIYAHSAQKSQQYTISACYDFSKADFSADLDLRKFVISEVVKFSVPNRRIQDFFKSGITFSGTACGNISKRTYIWNGKGSLSVPESIVKGGELVKFSALGNNERVDIQSFTATGSLLECSATGVYDIAIRKPSGTVSLQRITLPNGNSLSGEIYVEAMNGTVRAFMPQLYLGNQQFTALEATATPVKGKVSFTFEMGDYSHADYEKPAEIKMVGTYFTGKNKNLSATVYIDSLFLDSAAKVAAFFTKEESSKKILSKIQMLSPFITSDEISFSTDFKQVYFKAPFALLANTSRQKQMAFFAFEGNERSVQVSDFNIIYGKHSVHAKIGVDISPEDSQVAFSSSFEINKVPYSFNGIYTKGRWLNIKGSYGIDVIANLENGINGTASIASLPVAVSNMLFKLSAESDFKCRNVHDFLVNLTSIQLELEEHRLNRSPKIALTGSIDPDGLVFNAINFSDVSTSSTGSGYVRWNIEDGIINSLNTSFSVGNELTSEHISLEGTVSNPLKKTLSKETFMKDYYFNAAAQIQNFPLIRFVPKQYADDTFNGSVVASGTIENPYISLNIDSLSAQYGTKPVIVNGKAELIEGDVSVPSFNLSWGFIKLADVNASLSLKEFNAKAQGKLTLSVLGGRLVNIPLDLSLKNTDENKVKVNGKRKFIPEKFVVTGDSDVTAKGLINGSIPVHAEVRRDGRVISFASDEEKGVTGSYTMKEGTFICEIPSDRSLHGSAKGNIRKGKIDLVISNIFCNFARFSELVSTDFFGLYDGIMSGRISISGMTSDAILDGALLVRNFEFNLPLAIPDHMKSRNVLITLDDKRIEVAESKFSLGNNALSSSALLVLERWGVSLFRLRAESLKDSVIPVNMSVPNVDIKGNAAARVELEYTGRELSIGVKGALNNSELHVLKDKMSFSARPKKTDVEEKESLYSSLTRVMNVKIKVDAVMGKKVNIVKEPLLRALVVPNTKFHFDLDSGQGVWNLKSNIALRGGQITYLTRNFFIKEGLINLNESQNGFNPFITLSAETRERDSNNIPVTIILAVENQPLANFTGRIYSIPSRTEAQIMAMLGQIATGDSDNVGGLFFSSMDYGMHVTLLRKMENSLRDLFNFDIFSIRINVLQNSLKYGMAASSGSETDKAIFRNPIGNYLDNSSVYIGKYFGNSIYADVLLQWNYDETLARKSKFVGSGLVFHPEVGLEFDAPFAKIRWNFAPDLTALHNGEVPSIVSGTSVTLSWRFTF